MGNRMLRSRPVETQSRIFRPPGSLIEHQARVIDCASEPQLLEIFEHFSQSNSRLTLVGNRRSFGQHFIPVDHGTAVDISALDRGARVIEQGENGHLWVAVGGGTRFMDLARAFPNHRVRAVPTSDRITVAGALAACAHSSRGYFADSVRAFRLLTPRGDIYDCSAQAGGLPAELFRAVPGSFGALGATTQLQIELVPIGAEQLMGVHAYYASRQLDDGFFAALDSVKNDPRFDEGMGGVIYGNRGKTIVMADEKLPLDFKPQAKRQALLTDNDLEAQGFTHGLANRFPRIAEATVTKSYPEGIMRWAPWYGFQFYQRGYDQAYEQLSKTGIKHKLARLVGVDRRVPVAHQAWFFPRRLLRSFVENYFSVLDQFPGIEKQGEQQDIVLLGPSRWSAHSIGRTHEDVGVFTASYSLTSLSERERARVLAFFHQVTKSAYDNWPEVRISLSKQVHCERALLRSMHRPWIELIGTLKAQVDPQNLLWSRHLEELLGASS